MKLKNRPSNANQESPQRSPKRNGGNRLGNMVRRGVSSIRERVKRYNTALKISVDHGRRRIAELKSSRIFQGTIKTYRLIKNSIQDITSSRMVTLSIEGSTVSLIEVRGKTVTKWGKSEFTPSITDEYTGLISFDTAIKNVLNISGIRPSRVVFSTGGIGSINRLIPLPVSMPMGETPASIKTLINEALPLSEKEMHYAWKIINVDGERYVYCMGLAKDTLNDQIRILRKHKLNPYIIESRVISLARVVKKERAIIVNINSASVEYISISNGIPSVTFTKPWQPVTDDIDAATEKLVLDIRVLIDYQGVHSPGMDPQELPPIYVVGPGARGEIVVQLGLRLSNIIEKVTPSFEHLEKFPVSQYAGNLGAALRMTVRSSKFHDLLHKDFNIGGRKNVSTQNIDSTDDYESLALNLIPVEFRPWRPTTQQLLVTVLIVFALSVFYPIFDATSRELLKTSTLESQYKNLDSALQRRKTDIKNQEPLVAAINNFNTITHTAGYFYEDLMVIQDVANDLGIVIVSISHEGQNIKLDYSAPNPDIYRDYMHQLFETGRFSKITYPEEGYPFASSGEILLVSAQVRSENNTE